MDVHGVTLAVDIGQSTTVAAVDHNGHRTALVFGDSLSLATPTVGDDPSRDLITAMGATRGDVAESVIGALADHLRNIATYIGKVDELLILIPPSWGPRHHTMLANAAKATSLPAPHVLSEAAAVATHTYPDAPDDATVLVCQLGQHASHITVVQRHAGDWTRIATQPVPAATGDLLDRALAHLITPDITVVADQVLNQIRDARLRLIAGQPIAIVLPGRPHPATIDPADLQVVAGPLQQAAVNAALDTLDAAAVDPQQLHGTVVYGDSASALAPAQQLNRHLGSPATIAAEGRLAAVFGALDSKHVTTTAGIQPALRAAWARQGAHLIAPLAATAVGALLQWQIFDIVARLMPPQIYRLPSDYEKLRVYFDTAAFAAAGWAVALACIAVARNFAAVLIMDPSTSRAQIRQAGQIFAFGALVGLALASLQGLVAQAILGGPPDIVPPYLTTALIGAAIPAAVAMIVGLAAPWLTARPSWTDRVHHPTIAVVLAVTGILAAQARSSGLPIDGIPKIVGSLLGLCGAGFLGVAIALTLVTHRLARLVLGTLMGIACLIIVGTSNLHSAIVIYLIVVAVWWIRRGSRILADNLPQKWWQHLGLADNSST